MYGAQKFSKYNPHHFVTEGIIMEVFLCNISKYMNDTRHQDAAYSLCVDKTGFLEENKK
jgi:hypothetical protein